MAAVTRAQVPGEVDISNMETCRIPHQQVRDWGGVDVVDGGRLPAQFGRYRILEKLGEGGMGRVYLAEDTVLLRYVALKTPTISPTNSDDRMIRRFLREARAAATIHHPNVCPIFDVGQLDGRYFLTMAYIRGRTLAQWVESKDGVQPHEALRIIHQLSLGLHAAHEAGVIHRDVKPGNVMMIPTGEPVIIDFGTVRLLTGDQITQSNTFAGTPAYAAPEQITGDYECGPAVDVYSLGVILYELLTGRRPFEGSLTTMIAALVCDEPLVPASLSDELDPRLNELCMRALAKIPDQRYESPGAFAAAIDEYIAGR
ncbi:MAG: serine/threonine protein kinase [Pirellulales bacterium]|nr:serine/threonine protein kinase [Pirellulales bacterium]